MNRYAVALLVAAGLALAGCSSAPNDGGTVDDLAAETSAPAETTAPSPAKVTPTPTPVAESSPESDMREIIRYGFTHVPADEDELFAAAQYACEQILAGVPENDIVAIEGVNDVVNDDFVFQAHFYLCPDETTDGSLMD